MTRGRLIVLCVSGALLVALTGAGLAIQRVDNLDWFLVVIGLQGAVCMTAGAAVWNASGSRQAIFGIAAIAILMRIPIVLLPPYLSTDVYRYVWDGRVEAAGINPYRYVPDDPHLKALRDGKIFPNINRAGYAVTIYPPVAEAIFFAVTRISATVTAMKAAMVGFEVVTFMMLVGLLGDAGLPTGRVLLYAWHPLPLWEFAGSGHIDAAYIAMVTASLWLARRGRGWPEGILSAAATATKIYPVVLVPALYRRWDWKMPAGFAAMLALCYLPFLDVGWRVLGFLPGYAGEEGFVRGGAGFYLLAVLRRVPGLGALSTGAYVGGAAAILLALGLAATLRREPATVALPGAALLSAVFVALISPHYAWYFAWLVPFACLVRSFSLLWLSAACWLLYLIPVGMHVVRDDHRMAIESLIYGPCAALGMADLWYHRRRFGRSC